MIGDITPYGSKTPLIKSELLENWLLSDDGDLMVFNKPGWVVCHPSKNGPWSSLVGAAREYTHSDVMHLIARLDRETSGLTLICRDKKRASTLQQAFEKRQTTKRYIAILEGELSGVTEVSKALEPDAASAVGVKMRVAEGGGGDKAQTTFVPITFVNGYTLCEVRPHTGRKHQIRAHAQWLGHPIVADKLYGGDETLYLEFTESGLTPRLMEALPMPRQALHAWRLEIHEEDLNQEFEAPLAADMLLFMKERMGLSELPSGRQAAAAGHGRRRAKNDR